MMPVIAWNALHASTHPARGDARAADALRRRHRASTRRAAASCSTAAPRSPPRSARISATPRPRTSPRPSVSTGRPIRELVRERGLLPDDQLDAILSAEAMTSPGVPGQTAAADVPTARTDDHAGTRGARPGGGQPADAVKRRRRATARPAVRPKGSGDCWRGRTGTRGSGRIRSWTRCGSPTAASSLTWAPAAAGSPSGWPAGSGRTAASTPRTSSAQMIESIDRRVKREGLQRRGSRRCSAPRWIRSCRPARSTPC